MSKASDSDQTAKRYIINCIDGTGYDRELKTTDDKIRFFESCFRNEYGHEITRKGDQKAMSDYLAGLPSCCSVEYRNHEILQIAEQWGSLSPESSEKEKDRILENWFNLLAAKSLQLFRGFRVPKEPPKGYRIRERSDGFEWVKDSPVYMDCSKVVFKTENEAIDSAIKHSDENAG